MDIWKKRTQKNLTFFLEEFRLVCESSRRDVEKIRIIFATKYLSKHQFVSFIDIAQHIDILSHWSIGENRVQEAEKKIEYLHINFPKLKNTFNFSLIGILQKNKINKAKRIFNEIHALDSVKIANQFNKRLDVAKKDVFLEVNLSGEASKHGIQKEGAEEAIKEIRAMKNLELKGLITIAPYTDNTETIRGVFRELKNIADKHNLLTSMGMSSDWKIAIEEGADVVRIGSRIFQNT